MVNIYDKVIKSLNYSIKIIADETTHFVNNYDVIRLTLVNYKNKNYKSAKFNKQYNLINLRIVKQK